MLQTARAMPAQLCLHRRRDEQIRFAPDRSDSRACDHRCAARSADGGGSARQRRRERSEAARAADREAEVHDRQAPSPAVRAILEQLELQLSELQADASEAAATAQLAAAAAASEKIKVQGFERHKPARRPLPEHLPRERIVYPSPSACPCCG